MQLAKDVQANSHTTAAAAGAAAAGLQAPAGSPRRQRLQSVLLVPTAGAASTALKGSNSSRSSRIKSGHADKAFLQQQQLEQGDPANMPGTSDDTAQFGLDLHHNQQPLGQQQHYAEAQQEQTSHQQYQQQHQQQRRQQPIVRSHLHRQLHPSRSEDDTQQDAFHSFLQQQRQQQQQYPQPYPGRHPWADMNNSNNSNNSSHAGQPAPATLSDLYQQVAVLQHTLAAAQQQPYGTAGNETVIASLSTL